MGRFLNSTSARVAGLAAGGMLAACGGTEGQDPAVAEATVDAAAPAADLRLPVADAAASPEADAGHPYAPIDVLVPYAEQSCRRAVTCCAQNGTPFGFATCLDATGESLRTLAESLERGAISIDAAAAAACLAFYEAGANDCAAEEPPACTAMVRGLRRPGSGCDLGVECDAAAGIGVCERPNGLGTGECVQYPAGGAGAACRYTCGEGHCSETRPSAEVPAGSVVYCDSAAGLACDPDSGVCVAGGAEGEACTAAGCREGLGCRPDDGLCGVLPGLGAPCPDGACLEGYCADGVCRAQVSWDGPCDPNVPGQCVPGSACLGGGTCGPVLTAALRADCARYAGGE